MTTPNNTTLPQGPYTYNSGITGTTPFITVFSLRNPLTSDVNYPIQKRWINFSTTPPSEWILESISVVQEMQSAIWKLLTGPGSGTVLGFIVPLGSSPVFPDSSGFVTYTSTGGTVLITGSTNTINFDIVGGAAPVQRLQTDDGLFETPTGTPGTIIIHGTGGITTSQGTAHQVNINFSDTGLVESITGDDSVAVVPDSSGNINLFGNVVTNATHAKAVYTHSPVAHEEQIDVQVSAAIASTDITKVGLAAFNSAQFTVDANGFVALVGGGGSFNAIHVQTFTPAGTYTYTPTANMAYCIVEIVGGGGGGGGTSTTGASTCSAGGGGGGSGYSRKTFSAATIGASQTVVIGGGGGGGSSSGGNGSAGANSTFGAFLTAGGGGSGQGSIAATIANFSGGNSGAGSGGDINCTGQIGICGLGIASPGLGVNSGSGGNSFFGGGALCRTLSSNTTSQAGFNGNNYGGGGSGAASGTNAAGAAGGNGSDGFCIVTEFIT